MYNSASSFFKSSTSFEKVQQPVPHGPIRLFLWESSDYFFTSAAPPPPPLFLTVCLPTDAKNLFPYQPRWDYWNRRVLLHLPRQHIFPSLRAIRCPVTSLSMYPLTSVHFSQPVAATIATPFAGSNGGASTVLLGFFSRF